MDISERKKKILTAVIEEYIASAEPVGSKTISQKSGLGLSSATIRNEMAELEAMGLLEQPHTSAGRVPSHLGYRLYVNELMLRHKLSVAETEEINRGLMQKMQQLDRLIADVGRLASQLTSYPALALAAPASATIRRYDLIFIDSNTFIIVTMLSNNTVMNKLVNLPVSVEQAQLQKIATVCNSSFTGISEDKITPRLISTVERATGDTMGLVAVIAGFSIEILSEAHTQMAFVSGETNILKMPEYRDPDKAHRLISYLGDSEKLLELPAPTGEGDVKVLIGAENVAEELRDSSVVMASYNMGDDTQGMIGVVGPTRMDYSKIAAKIGYLAERLSELLGNQPPGIEGKGG